MNGYLADPRVLINSLVRGEVFTRTSDTNEWAVDVTSDGVAAIAATSIIGNPSSLAGSPSAIICDTNNQFLVRRAGGLVFDELDASDIPSLSSTYQPLDSDLTAIAALTTASYGRSLLTLANATALAAEVDSFFLTPTEGNAAYQPLDSDLTAIAALTTTTFGRSLLTLADAAASRVLPLRVVAAAGAATITATDYFVVINKTVGAATVVNLPAPVTGQPFVIKDGKGDCNANNITITPAAGTIDGAATLVMNVNYQAVRVVHNGTEWNVV